MDIKNGLYYTFFFYYKINEIFSHTGIKIMLAYFISPNYKYPASFTYDILLLASFVNKYDYA